MCDVYEMMMIIITITLNSGLKMKHKLKTRHDQ